MYTPFANTCRALGDPKPPVETLPAVCEPVVATPLPKSALATVPLMPLAPPDPLPCPGPAGISNDPSDAEGAALPVNYLTALIALYKCEREADREADRLMAARSSDATPEANSELHAQAMRLRAQAGDCRRLHDRLTGVCAGR